MHHISDYRDQQQYGPLIAERVWTAWWQDSGFPLSNVIGHMEEMADAQALPNALVAHDTDGYAGSVFIIDCDLEERPQYTPWIAALWVEERARNTGIGKALLRAATDKTSTLGYTTTYLCCHRGLESYYEGMGWSRFEQGVGDRDLTVMIHIDS